MKSAVITFPGSNCDRDMAVAIETVTGARPQRLWHGDPNIPEKLDFIAVPGGFSYGDYLRSGAMAARSPIMASVVAAANRGVAVLGVCNGFQVLAETGLLPGALMRNAGMSFVCRDTRLKVENANSIFTSSYDEGEEITIPVAHHDGNFFADDNTVSALEDSGRVAFRYAEKVNGSVKGIAGILSEKGNVLGMMPHPERMVEPAHGGSDGRKLFESVMAALVTA